MGFASSTFKRGLKYINIPSTSSCSGSSFTDVSGLGLVSDITHSSGDTFVQSFKSNSSVTWSLGGDDQAKFMISSDGVLSFASDTPPTSFYNIDIKATAFCGTTTHSLDIKVDHLGVDGTNQADSLISSRAPEIIDAGEGFDSVSFSGNFENYQIYIRSITEIDITDNRHRFTAGFDGSDTLKNIYYLCDVI